MTRIVTEDGQTKEKTIDGLSDSGLHNHMRDLRMSRKGNCWDNAVAESFFKSLKAKCIYQHKFTDKQQAALIVFAYIETWYNRKRQHSALGYLSPEEFGRNLNKQNIVS